jgi:hypothetical protein
MEQTLHNWLSDLRNGIIHSRKYVCKKHEARVQSLHISTLEWLPLTQQNQCQDNNMTDKESDGHMILEPCTNKATHSYIIR